MVAEKTAKNFRGLLYFAAPCTILTYLIFSQYTVQVSVVKFSGGCQWAGTVA